MSDDVTPTQALLLFGLLAVHGECAQAELMPAATKADREALEAARLIGVKKTGRAYFLSLTDRGWDWASANLSAELPPPQRALHELLGRLGEHLAKSGGSLAGFVGSKPEKKFDSKPQIKAGTKRAAALAKPKASSVRAVKTATRSKASTVDRPKGATKSGKAPTPAALRKRIEAAYLSITNGRRNESVRLARLRQELPDLDRPTIDAALGRILKSDKKVSLMRHDDPAQLSPADHAAAFNPAGEPFHVIWIAS